MKKLTTMFLALVFVSQVSCGDASSSDSSLSHDGIQIPAPEALGLKDIPVGSQIKLREDFIIPGAKTVTTMSQPNIKDISCSFSTDYVLYERKIPASAVIEIVENTSGGDSAFFKVKSSEAPFVQSVSCHKTSFGSRDVDIRSMACFFDLTVQAPEGTSNPLPKCNDN